MRLSLAERREIERAAEIAGKEMSVWAREVWLRFSRSQDVAESGVRLGTLRRSIKIGRAIAGGQSNGVRLAKALGVSRRTLARDLVFMRTQLNAPIVFDEGDFTLHYSTPFDADLAILDWLSKDA